MTSDLITLASIMVTAFVLLRVFEKRMGHRIGEPDMQAYESKVKALSFELQTQKTHYEKEITDLKERIDFLIGQLLRAGFQIEELKITKAGTKIPAAPVLAPLPEKPLLLICGSEASFCEADRQALRLANIPFQRLVATTKQGIIAELRRRRQDETLYPWIQISAHAGNDGVTLSDGVASPDWWHEQLKGVEVVFLAACKSSAVADKLAGMVTVIFVIEDIENTNAADFTYAFWRRMMEHRDPRRAYRQALNEVPQVAEYTDIRIT